LRIEIELALFEEGKGRELEMLLGGNVLSRALAFKLRGAILKGK
jgi:hypothetical protein